jgi:integration host factor subunit beta
MIKSELVQRLAEKNLHLHRADLEKVVNAILDQIESALAQRHRVELRGFGVALGCCR